VSPVKYEMGFYISKDGILYGHHLEHLKSYIEITSWALWRGVNVFPVRCELRFYKPEKGIVQEYANI
jgi:hypothetical protein